MGRVIDFEKWLDYLDPLYYMTAEEYELFWREVLNYAFQGNIARFFGVLLLMLAFFFGAVKQRFGMGLLCFAGAVTFAYIKAFQMLLS